MGVLEQLTETIQKKPTASTTLHQRSDEEAQLIVLVGPSPGRRFVVKAEVLLGRAVESPLELHDEGVSRRHARVFRDERGFAIEDLASRNGTFVNGERLQGKRILAFGDKIAVGSRSVLLFASRDRFEDQRIQAQRLQALGQLSGGIAHDFNNLLGVVLANTSHLQQAETLDSEQVQRALADIEIAARRAVDLTHQLLTFARSGKRQHELVDLSSIADEAEHMLRRTLHRGIEIYSHVEPTLTVEGDASQLLQVLMNLCINSGDAMPEGGVVRIEAVRVRYSEADIVGTDLLTPGEFAAVRVIDEGVGMVPEVLARVFEPFFTTKPRGKGTGLGLATVHAIVRDHGGVVRVDSEPGNGTAFEVLLPCCAPLADRPKPRNTPPSALPTAVVLLADDEELVRRAANRVLRRAGIEVVEAVDGEEAIEKFEANAERVDLVILDLDMPRLDGEQAFYRLAQLAPTLPVLISSGYVGPDREESLLKDGVHGLLHKPYDSASLIKAVRTALAANADAAHDPDPTC